MKSIIIIFLIWVNLAQASNFEIKIAINLNDCINCSNYLYSLNNISKKYKITVLLSSEIMEDSAYAMEQIIGSKIKNFKIEISDSLYKLYAHKSQNYLTAFKNDTITLSTLLKNINSKIDTLNELSFETGDTIPLNYKIEARNKSKILNNNLYILNPRINTFHITNLLNGSTAKLNFSRQLLENIFKKTFNGSTQKLTEIEEYCEAVGEKYGLKIGSFDVNKNGIYLLVYTKYIEEITNSNLDTTLNYIAVLLEYKKGETNPIIYPLTVKLANNEYDFSQHEINMDNNDVLVSVLLKNEKNDTEKMNWICKCKLEENIFLDTSNCIKRSKLHSELKLKNNFSEYKLAGDFLINTITNELVNHQTKKVTMLKIPFSKIIPNKSNSFKFESNYSIIDLKIEKNKVQVIYYMDSCFNYVLYNLETNKLIEKYILFSDFKNIKSPPQFFSKTLLYYFTKQNSLVINEIKPL